MTTAAKLTNSACTYIGVKRLGVDLTAPEYDEAVDLIRDMLIEMQTRNIKFRVDIPSSSTDEINEPDWASSYLKTELAIRLCPLYTVSVSSELMRSHREAKRAVYSFLVDLTDIQKPDILPIGQGNQESGFGNQRKFYTSNHKDAIATGSGSLIETTEGEQFVTQPNDSILRG